MEIRHVYVVGCKCIVFQLKFIKFDQHLLTSYVSRTAHTEFTCGICCSFIVRTGRQPVIVEVKYILMALM